MRDQGVWERNKHGKTDKGTKGECCAEKLAGHCVCVATSCACEHSPFCILIKPPF